MRTTIEINYGHTDCDFQNYKHLHGGGRDHFLQGSLVLEWRISIDKARRHYSPRRGAGLAECFSNRLCRIVEILTSRDTRTPFSELNSNTISTFLGFALDTANLHPSPSLTTQLDHIFCFYLHMYFNV